MIKLCRRRRRLRPGKRSGFSLMEMMSALMVLVIGAVSVFSLLMVSIQSGFESSHYSIARTLAQQQMETYRIAGTSTPTAGTTTVDESSQLPSGTMTTVVTSQSTAGQTNLVLINITVAWREPGRGSVSLAMTTQVCDTGISTS